MAAKLLDRISFVIEGLTENIKDIGLASDMSRKMDCGGCGRHYSGKRLG